ncbi:MAG: oligosaccharide flippase family protein [Kiloniellales bacterium]
MPARFRVPLLHWLSDGLLRRVFRNAGLLAGGQVLAGLLTLVAISVAARVLGAEMFGVLVLIHAYALLMGNLTGFKAWRAVIRYGAICIQEDRRDDLRGLIGLVVLLDAAGATVGVLAAVLGLPWLAPWLGWPDEAVRLGQWYCLVILFLNTGTPTGILRLFDRFGLSALQKLVHPTVCLIGALLAYATAADYRAFAAIWFTAALIDGVTIWALGWRELARRGYGAGLRAPLRGLARPHSGFWRLIWATHLDSSLGAVSGRVSTLIIGALLGPAAAGLFQIAVRFSSALERPVEMLRRSIYPEFAKLHAAGDAGALRRLAVRAALIVGCAAAPILLGVAAFGEPLLRLTVGDAFIGAHDVLVLLIAALAIGTFGFPVGSLLVAQGRSGVLLAVNLIAALLYVALLVLLLGPIGLAGAGIAAVVKGTGTVLATGTIAIRGLGPVIGSTDRTAPAR